jgi:hypothetical protein
MRPPAYHSCNLLYLVTLKEFSTENGFTIINIIIYIFSYLLTIKTI